MTRVAIGIDPSHPNRRLITLDEVIESAILANMTRPWRCRIEVATETEARENRPGVVGRLGGVRGRFPGEAGPSGGLEDSASKGSMPVNSP